MIIAHYQHRLPSDYDIDQIRQRARERGALWNDRPDLYFKAFLLRERGSFAAAWSSYSSLYLWRHDNAFRDFLVDGGYRIVIDMFGRAPIDTRIALDARKGDGNNARFAYRQDISIAPDTDIAATLAQEIERNADTARLAGVVAAAVGIDVANWTMTRALLSENEVADHAGTLYQILNLARPLLDTLP
jgi:hypothetical protein